MPRKLQNKLSAANLSALRTKLSQSKLTHRPSVEAPSVPRISFALGLKRSPTLETLIAKRRAMDPLGPRFDVIKNEGFFFRPTDTLASPSAYNGASSDAHLGAHVDNQNLIQFSPVSYVEHRSEPSMLETDPTRVNLVAMATALNPHPPIPPLDSRSMLKADLFPSTQELRVAASTTLHAHETKYQTKSLPVLPDIGTQAQIQFNAALASQSLVAMSQEEKHTRMGAARQLHTKRKPIYGGIARAAVPSMMEGLTVDYDAEHAMIGTAGIRTAVKGYMKGVGWVSRVIIAQA